MKLFKRTPPVPTYDPNLHDADVYLVNAHLERGDWDAAAAVIAQRAELGSRQWLINAVAPETLEPWVDRWVAARPEHALPLLVRGITGIKWAWHARGGGRADTVEQDAWQVFWDRLQEADAFLARASEIDPDDPIPASESLPIVRGLQLSHEELWTRFTYVVERDRWNCNAHLHMVQSLAPKWSGTIAQLREFSSTVVEQAPEGHPVHCVEAAAVIEEWLDDDESSSFFRDRDVRHRVKRAADKSIASDAFGSGPDEAWALNLFALCFLRMNDTQRLRATVEQIDDQITSWPWEMFGDPAKVYRSAFKAAYK